MANSEFSQRVVLHCQDLTIKELRNLQAKVKLLMSQPGLTEQKHNQLFVWNYEISNTLEFKELLNQL